MNTATKPLPRTLVGLVLGLAVLAFARTLHGGFLGDDFVYIARFAELPWRDWPGLFVREWSGGIWNLPLKELRPFAALSLMIESRLFGADPVGYRLVNLGVFLFSAWLVMQLAWRYSRENTAAALAAGVLFVLSPIQAEPVSWITGRVDLIAAAAALAFWHFASRYLELGGRTQWLAACAALFVGVFSKEFSLLAPFLFLLSWLLIPASRPIPAARRWRIIAGVAAIIVLYTLARHSAFGTDATSPNSTWRDAGAWQRQLSYLGWIFPVLPFQHQLEGSAGWPATRLQLLGMLLVTTVLIAAVWQRRRSNEIGSAIVFFGGVWWIGTILTLLLVAYFSPRHLHFGSAGLAIATGIALGAVRLRPIQGATLLALGVWLGAGQFHAVSDWQKAGQISREVSARLAAHVAAAPQGSILLFHAPGQWRTAWLLPWSAPHLGSRAFIGDTRQLDAVFAAPWNHYRPDSWGDDVAAKLPAALERASNALALRVRDDGTVTDRVLTGAELRTARARLPTNALGGPEWQEWIQSLTP